MIVELQGHTLQEGRRAAASFLAHTCARDVRSEYLLEAAAPRKFAISSSVEKYERDRLRSKISATKTLAHDLRAGIAKLHSSILRALKLHESDSRGGAEKYRHALIREADTKGERAKIEEQLAAVDRTALSDAFGDTLEDVYEEGAASAVGELSLALGFDVKPQKAMDALYQRTMKFAAQVTDREMDAVKATLLEGLDAGATYKQMSEAIADFVDFVHVGERAIPVDTWAETVARTETARANNAGVIGVYKRVGVKRIMWLAAEDERTCPICVDLDGTTAVLGEPFEESDSEATEPPEHPDCRCTVVAADDDGADSSEGAGDDDDDSDGDG